MNENGQPNSDALANENDRHPVEVIAEEFSERLRRGQRPSIAEYLRMYPEHAELIQAIFPSLEIVERVSSREIGSKTGPTDPRLHQEHTSFGDFKILCRIGMGGMGIVYEAIQQSLNRHVALKVILPSSSEKAGHQQRFRREAEAAASLHHTHIVPIFGIGEDHGLQYYAMQLIDGVTLHQVVDALRSRVTRSGYDGSATPQTSREHEANCDASSQRSTIDGVPSKWQTRSSDAARRLIAGQVRERRFPLERAGNEVTETDLNSRVRGTVVMDRKATNEATSFPSEATDQSSVELESGTIDDVPTKNSYRIDPEQDNSLDSSASESILLGDAASIDWAASSDWTIACLPHHYYRNVCRMIANVANALEYAHQSGVLHRDIKPANLLIDTTGSVWVTDFGLARREDIDETTQAGEAIGTLRYMAPEQIAGRGDHRVDIYGLGLTLFEMLTLEYAIASPKARLFDPIKHSDVAFNARQIRSIPRDLRTIVLKACEFNPSDRYSHARELESDLRRFLEDRPISARPIGLLESLVRWARRNPMVASLATCVASLFLVMTGMLLVWNRQQQHAIDRISEEFERAEFHLTKKSEALERAGREQRRAEMNMSMAIEALGTITANIASRGHTISLLSADEDSTDALELADEFSVASLSEADIKLLHSIQSFFGRFAEENETDLGLETAIARRRVGEIQHKLGKLDDAITSLEKSIADFTQLEARNSIPVDDDQHALFVANINARQELVSVYAKKGQVPKAVTLFSETRKWFEKHSEFRESIEGKYEWVKLLNNMASISSGFSKDRRRKPAMLPFQRVQAGMTDTIPPAQRLRWKREIELNSEALSLLKDLVQSKPENIAFQLTLARTYRDRARLHRNLNDIPAADQEMLSAIEILESRIEEQPNSRLLQFEFAEILGTPIAFRDLDEDRYERALALCEEVLATDPLAPEALALKAALLLRATHLGPPGQGRGEMIAARWNQALAIQSDLVERFPSVPMYAMALLQSHMQLAELYSLMRRSEKAKELLNEAERLAHILAEAGVAPALVKSTLDRLHERRTAIENRSEIQVK
ncbi:MAG: serine/threonine-protein kinase [Planctomycetota bacterium]